MSDVFISYNGIDRPVVESICSRLVARGLRPFFDTWDLIPGRRWQHGLLAALDAYSSAAICFGPNGLGDWQRQEMEIALNRHAKEGDRFPVIPVLLPGVDPTDAPLGFLKLNTWVDLRGQSDEQIAALVAAVKGEKRGPPSRLAADVVAAINPYRGLAYFREDDAPLFFGREVFSAEVLKAVQASRFVAVVGASGSGKSSIAHAGLLPKLRDPASGQVWAIHTMVPGTDPAERLAEVLAHALNPQPDATAADLDEEVVKIRRRIVVEAEDEKGALGRLVRQVCAKRPGITRVLLLIDQFEEAFTLATKDKAEATARFIEELVLAAGNPEAPLTIVVTLRGDQYHQVTDRRALAALFAASQVNVGPMTQDELRQAIVAPLEKVGGRFQYGLVDRIVAEVGTETNALPLLEYALDALWTRRDPVSGELTHVAYNAMGGLKHAIAERANEIFRALPLDQQKATREVLLRLVRPGAGTLDSKRPADLGAVNEATKGAIAALARERLISADTQKIEIVHEALIREWDLLRGWVNEARGDLALRDRLEGDADRWAQLADADPTGADTLLLPPGLRLEEGRRLVGAETGLLDGFPTIRRYIERSIAHDKELAAAAQQKLDTELARTKRQNRRLQVAIIAAAIMLLVAGAAGVGVWHEKQSLDFALADARAGRAEADKEKLEAQAQKQIAQRNFTAAKSAIEGLVFDVAQGLQHVAGIRTETIRAILETVRRTVEGLLAAQPDDVELLRLKTVMLNNFVKTYMAAGDIKSALKSADASVEIAKKLLAQAPNDPGLQRDLSVSLYRLGSVRFTAGDRAGALAAYEDGLDIAKKLAVGDPGNSESQRGVPVFLSQIGDIKLRAGDRPGALAAYQRTLDILEKLAVQDPNNPEVQRDLSLALDRMGDAKLDANDNAGALASYERGLDVAKKLAARDLGNAQLQRDVLRDLVNVGRAQLKLSRREEAKANFQKAAEIAERLAAMDLGNREAADDLAWVRRLIEAVDKDK